MNLNKYIKHHELYEFLRTKVDIPPIERTFFSSEYDHTLYRMAWMASNKQCEVTLGCHEQPFLLLISRIGEDMRRIHIPVLPEELAHLGLLERLENHTPSKLNVIQFYYVQSDYIQALKNAEFAVYQRSHVPDVDYKTHPKFLLGITLSQTPYRYAIPISSTNAVGLGNIPIMVAGDIPPKKGALRLSYMIPVPDQVLTPVDIRILEPSGYRNLVRKQYFALKPLREHISRSAEELYELVTQTSSRFVHECCDFRLLEYACHNYCLQHNFPSPSPDISIQQSVHFSL